ncbi:MAG: glycosyltransferase family 39 protein [Patescibacteria group bacterium]|nr:glycosyltransferase family 39 protein [Patescibacteria group bacterium]
MEKTKFKKIDFLILFFILLIAIICRFYKITSPLADLHSWRQADTAAVARNFIKYGFDLLHPRFDDLSPNQSAKGLENPNGYRMVEFPIYNAIVAVLNKNFPLLPIEVWGRLTTIFFSLIIIAIIYYLSLIFGSRITAFFSSLVYAIFPFFVFFSRVILPETTAVSFIFLAIFFLTITFKEEKNQKKHLKIRTNYFYYFLSIIFLAVSLLIKPTVIFYGITLFFIFVFYFKLKTFQNPFFYLYFLSAIIPFFIWRTYIQNYPEGIPPYDWLITSVNTSEGLKNIFFKPAFFRWIFFERINNLILGGYLIFFLILGLLTRPKNFFLHSIIFSGFLYLLVFQGGNVQHEYYQTIILPSLAFAVGLGVNNLLSNQKVFLPLWLSIPSVLLLFGLSFFFSFYKVKDFYNYPPELPQIAKVINNLTKPNDKIITDRMGDTTLLYLSDRKGAPSVYKPIDDLKKIGYTYLAVFNKETAEKIKSENKYQIVFENEYFIFFKL